MVVPVPCWLALLLKFETRMSPGLSGPPVGKPWRHEGDAVGVQVAIGRDRRQGLERAIGQVRHDGRRRREWRNGLQRAEQPVRSRR